jgi:hypothetical protein
MTLRGFVLLRGQVLSVLARLKIPIETRQRNCLLRIETVRGAADHEKRENEAKTPLKIRLKQGQDGYYQHTSPLAKMNIC